MPPAKARAEAGAEGVTAGDSAGNSAGNASEPPKEPPEAVAGRRRELNFKGKGCPARVPSPWRFLGGGLLRSVGEDCRPTIAGGDSRRKNPTCPGGRPVRRRHLTGGC